MTEKELDLKLNSQITMMVGFIIGYLLMKYEGLQLESLDHLIKAGGVSSQAHLVIKQATEREIAVIEQTVSEISSGVRLDPLTGQRIIAGLKGKTTLREKVPNEEAKI